jgi:hypothetical protein
MNVVLPLLSTIVSLIFAGFLANYEVIASRFAWKVKPASQ